MKKLILLILVISLFSCNKKKKQAKVDDDIIVNYLAKNQLTATKTESGLYYIINNLGVGEKPTRNSTVRVAYRGYFTNNNPFDDSDTTGITFSLNSVIEGWQEGIPYFKPGGRGVLLIPSALGYGSTARQGIPANSVLIFDINLKEVE